MNRLVLLSILIPLTAAAGPPDHAPGLLELLNGIDVVPSAADLRRVTEAPQSELFEVALDPELPLYPRNRATSLLSAFPDPTSEAYLTMLAVAQTHPRLRWGAIYTYVRTWAQSAPERVTTFAVAALKSPLPLDREAAALGLGWVKTPRAIAALGQAKKTEADRRVLAALNKALARAAR